MNRSHAEAQWTGSGYIGLFSPYWSTRPQKVTDAQGNIRLFHDRIYAECHAWRALQAAEERIEALRFGPGQISLPAKPKSFAGKRALAQSVFREKEEA